MFLSADLSARFSPRSIIYVCRVDEEVESPGSLAKRTSDSVVADIVK